MSLRRAFPALARRRAFTLVEMMIAIVITALISIMMWNLVTSGTKTVAFGTWYSQSVAQLRTGLSMLRQDLGKATYPSVIDQTNVTVNDADENYWVQYKNGGTDVGTGTITLLKFYICRPDNKVPGLINDADEIECVLESVGDKLHYKRTRKKGTAEDATEQADEYDKNFIVDVERVEITLTPPQQVGGTGDSTATLTIKIKTRYPSTDKTKRGAEETTTAKLNVKYKTL